MQKNSNSILAMKRINKWEGQQENVEKIEIYCSKQKRIVAKSFPSISFSQRSNF